MELSLSFSVGYRTCYANPGATRQSAEAKIIFGHGRGTMHNLKSEFGRARYAFGGLIHVAATVVFVAATASLAFAEEYRWGGRVEQPQIAPAAAQARAQDESFAAAPAAAPILKESDIAGLRSALQLTPDQMPHWTPVAAALSQLARSQARVDAGSYVQRFRDRAAALANTAAQLRQLRSTAMPLIYTLNDNQKRAAMSFARRMGYGPLVAMF